MSTKTNGSELRLAFVAGASFGLVVVGGLTNSWWVLITGIMTFGLWVTLAIKAMLRSR